MYTCKKKQNADHLKQKSKLNKLNDYDNSWFSLLTNSGTVK